MKHKRHLVTASYISPDMRKLHQRCATHSFLSPHFFQRSCFSAVDNSVLLLNEVGLDPGLDHCSAFALLDRLQKKENKRVVSFASFCGGLPAPDNADVPFHYKFSWSPKGVLSAALNGASFRLNGEVREFFTLFEVPPTNVLSDCDVMP